MRRRHETPWYQRHATHMSYYRSHESLPEYGDARWRLVSRPRFATMKVANVVITSQISFTGYLRHINIIVSRALAWRRLPPEFQNVMLQPTGYYLRLIRAVALICKMLFQFQQAQSRLLYATLAISRGNNLIMQNIAAESLKKFIFNDFYRCERARGRTGTPPLQHFNIKARSFTAATTRNNRRRPHADLPLCRQINFAGRADESLKLAQLLWHTHIK